MKSVLSSFFLSVLFGLLAAETAQAQGLLWSLPEDGTQVRFEGSYTESVSRTSQEQAEEILLKWRRYLEIRSVGQEQAEYKGEMVVCRWLEFEVRTGKVIQGEVLPGPGGKRVYKVLVPEHEITGEITQNSILVAQIPIIKGYRRLGDSETEELQSNVFQIYPVISLLRHYQQMEQVGSENVSVPGVNGVINTGRWEGEMEMENETDYSRNSARIWRSDEVPFGIAKWEVILTRKKKNRTDPRSTFEEKDPYTTVRVEMSLHDWDTDAEPTLDF